LKAEFSFLHFHVLHFQRPNNTNSNNNNSKLVTNNQYGFFDAHLYTEGAVLDGFAH